MFLGRLVAFQLCSRLGTISPWRKGTIIFDNLLRCRAIRCACRFNTIIMTWILQWALGVGVGGIRDDGHVWFTFGKVTSRYFNCFAWIYSGLSVAVALFVAYWQRDKDVPTIPDVDLLCADQYWCSLWCVANSRYCARVHHFKTPLRIAGNLLVRWLNVEILEVVTVGFDSLYLL